MKPLLVFAFLGSNLAWAQDQPSVRARELFYSPPPDPTAHAKKPKLTPKRTTAPDAHAIAPNVPLGIRYSVMKRNDAGKYDEVDADTVFRTGDRVRFRVDTNTPGYLYVVMKGSSGNWKPLFPSPEVGGGSNWIEKGQSLQIPPGDSGQFMFDEQAGTEKIFVILSRQPEANIDKLIYSMGGSKQTLLAQATVGDDVIHQLRQQVTARDLVFEKVDTSSNEVKGENAAYVVNPSRAPDAHLVVDVMLKHN